MTKGKRIKGFLIFCIVCIALLFVYRWSPYKLEFLGFYEDKIWAHRVNSKEKLVSAIKYYNGVELDLVYNDSLQFFDVNHPPAKSINLSFESYLNTLSSLQQPYLWLDLKNLKQENAQVIFDRLQYLFENREYPIAKVLIETRFPEALPIFTEAGYKTSYYLPSDLKSKSKVELNTELNKITKILEEQPEIGISTHYLDYPILKTHFPEKPKYIWAILRAVNKNVFKTRAILNDKTVKVVLVNYRALNGNR